MKIFYFSQFKLKQILASICMTLDLFILICCSSQTFYAEVLANFGPIFVLICDKCVLRCCWGTANDIYVPISSSTIAEL